MLFVELEPTGDDEGESALKVACAAADVESTRGGKLRRAAAQGGGGDYVCGTDD